MIHTRRFKMESTDSESMLTQERGKFVIHEGKRKKIALAVFGELS